MSNKFFDQFGRFGPTGRQNANPMLNAINMAQMFRKIQNDPSQIADLLLNNGKITNEQYKDIQKFNGNPQLIVQYLLKDGTITAQDINNIKSSI